MKNFIFTIALLATHADAAQRGARDFYNDGVAKLGTGELREAESALIGAAREDDPAVLPGALYNLGHVRFLQGKETLKGGTSDRRQLLARAKEPPAGMEALIEGVMDFLKKNPGKVAEEDLPALIGAYNQARAMRKQLRQTRDELDREASLIDPVMSRWTRSVGDFRSALELDTANKDAEFNADVVGRWIEELKKFKEQLEMEQEGVGKKREELRKMMKEMRGKIPEEMQREDDGEEGDEDEDGEDGEPKKPKDKPGGKQEQRIGGERQIHPDLLRVLKEKMPNRTMSVGQEQPEGGGLRGEMERKGFGGDKPQVPGRKGKDW